MEKKHKGHRSAYETIPGFQMTIQVYNFHQNEDIADVLNTKLVFIQPTHYKPQNMEKPCSFLKE